MPPTPNPESSDWFAKEVQPHEAELRAYLRHRYPQARDVDDVIQESYLRLLRARDTTRIESTKGYLFTTARNLILGLFRRPRIFSDTPVTDFPVSSIPEEGPGVVEQVSLAQETELLLSAIESLPSRCREIFVLRKLQGLSQKEIARRLGLSEQTVQVQIARGAKRCAEILRRLGVRSPVPHSDHDDPAAHAGP